MNNPKGHLIIAIIAAIIYIVSFFQEQNLMNGIGLLFLQDWQLELIHVLKN